MRVILDTNVVFRAFANSESVSGQILKQCENRKLVLVLSRSVLLEYFTTLTHARILEKHPSFQPKVIRRALDRIRYRSKYLRQVAVTFGFERDPLDAKFVELAIAGTADCIVTTDHDLLSLPSSRAVAGKRFRQRLPNIAVVTPMEFRRSYPGYFET